MDDADTRLLTAFESHDAAAIRDVLASGADPNRLIGTKPAIDHLIEMYYRSDAFVSCLQAMLDAGGRPAHPGLLPVLLDDPDQLDAAVAADPDYLNLRIDMPCTFVALQGASLLHVAAEYGHLNVARRLLALGMPADIAAATDMWGLNGHTPLFHTVNANANRSAPMMQLLLSHGARADRPVAGLWWGRGFDWETVLFDVTPVSFAQMGLLPQFHRRETDIRDNVIALLTAAGRPVPPLTNIPNRYLV